MRICVIVPPIYRVQQTGPTDKIKRDVLDYRRATLKQVPRLEASSPQARRCHGTQKRSAVGGVVSVAGVGLSIFAKKKRRVKMPASGFFFVQILAPQASAGGTRCQRMPLESRLRLNLFQRSGSS
jgi:hypothetical protein